MKATLTKFFHFSASYADGSKMHGHNYRLGVTVGLLDEGMEERLEKKVRASLIQKLDSRDLGEDVDFLKGQKITDSSLLGSFWKLLEAEMAPTPLLSISLERDQRTSVVLSAETP